MNKKIKKIAVSAIAATLFAMPSANVFAATDLDTYFENLEEKSQKYLIEDTVGHWAEYQLTDFINSDYMGGYELSDGSYELRPNKTITRAEFAATIVRIMNLTQKGTAKDFKDVKKGTWFYEPIQIVASNGIAGGKTPTEFKPNDLITRAEISVMIQNAFGKTIDFKGVSKSFKDVKDNHWASGVIKNVSKAGIVGGYSDGSFKPNQTATRAEAAVMLSRAIDKETKGITVDNLTLTNAVQNVRISNLFEYASNDDYESLVKVMEKNTTGEYKTSMIVIVVMNEMTKEMSGGKLDVEETTAPVYTVKKKTPRKAIVKVTNNHMKMGIVDENGNPIVGEVDGWEIDGNFETQPVDGDYYLKKMANGTWKVYKYVPLDQNIASTLFLK